jgi:hypothetical protein
MIKRLIHQELILTVHAPTNGTLKFILKSRAGSMAQVAEQLPNKDEALSPKPFHQKNLTK